jgi:hypothetical protein
MVFNVEFKQYLEESVIKQIVYHGTDKEFKIFDLGKATQGLIWFTSDKASIEAGEAGAQGSGYILELKVNLKNPAGWEEYNRLVLDQLEQQGYDGAILPSGDHFDGFVFHPSQVEIISRTKVNS